MKLGIFLISTAVVAHCALIVDLGSSEEIEKIYHRTKQPTDYLHFVQTGEYKGDVIDDIRVALQRSSKYMFIDFVYEVLKVFVLFILTLIGSAGEQNQLQNDLLLEP